MVDQNKNTTPDDEYQFPQDEYVSAQTKSEAEVNQDAEHAAVTNKTSLGGLPFLKNKRILIVFGVVIVLLILFHFIGQSRVPVAPKPAPAQVVTPAPQPVVVQQPNTAFTSSTDQKIQSLESQLSVVQNSLSQSQAQNQTLQQSVAELSAQVQVMSEQLQRLLANEKMPKNANKIVFHLRAVLPDRAWISSNTGQTMSVTIGDRVQGYGIVQSIDVRDGVVKTSSGRKIEYGPNDY